MRMFCFMVALAACSSNTSSPSPGDCPLTATDEACQLDPNAPGCPCVSAGTGYACVCNDGTVSGTATCRTQANDVARCWSRCEYGALEGDYCANDDPLGSVDAAPSVDADPGCVGYEEWAGTWYCTAVGAPQGTQCELTTASEAGVCYLRGCSLSGSQCPAPSTEPMDFVCAGIDCSPF